MLFSVLMSVYVKDDPVFFEKALESVSIEQTVKPSQIVIVEDGPVSDSIEQVIEKVQEETNGIEFTVRRNKNNKGLAAALNDGISECKYDWIARMDSDDISAKERFEKQIGFLENNPETKVLGGSIAEFENNPGDIHSERHVGKNMDEIVRMARARTPMNHVSVMYSKSAVLTAGGYSENFGKLEDYKLWVDMISKNISMANLDDVLVYVRIGNGFLERRSNRREIEDWDMLQDYLIKSRIIGKFQSLKNKVYIRVFTYMPLWMKSFAYKYVLRKNA